MAHKKDLSVIRNNKKIYCESVLSSSIINNVMVSKHKFGYHVLNFFQSMVVMQRARHAQKARDPINQPN